MARLGLRTARTIHGRLQRWPNAAGACSPASPAAIAPRCVRTGSTAPPPTPPASPGAGQPARTTSASPADPRSLVIIDLDTPKPGQPKPADWAHATGVDDGADVLAALCEQAYGQPWPSETFTAATPGGGMHLLYFTAPPGTQLRTTAGRLGWLDRRPRDRRLRARPRLAHRRQPVHGHQSRPARTAARMARRPARRRPRPPPEVTGTALGDSMDAPQATGYALAALRGEVDRVLAASARHPQQHAQRPPRSRSASSPPPESCPPSSSPTTR